MRKAFSQQRWLDCPAIGEVPLNLECRCEIIPVLKALQHIYFCDGLLQQALDLIAADVNRDSQPDRGRKGLDY